jgi:hypothetical protein
VTAFHTLAVKSWLPVTTRFPSAEKAGAATIGGAFEFGNQPEGEVWIVLTEGMAARLLV